MPHNTQEKRDAYNRAYRQKHRERHRLYMIEYHKRHPLGTTLAGTKKEKPPKIIKEKPPKIKKEIIPKPKKDKNARKERLIIQCENLRKYGSLNQ